MGNLNWLIILGIGGLALYFVIWPMFLNWFSNSQGVKDAAARLSTPQAKARADQINRDLKAGKISQNEATTDVFKMALGSNYAYYY